MNKRIISIILALLLCMVCTAYISADEEHSPRLVDGAGLLSQDEYKKVETELDSISEHLQFDIIIRTVLTTEGEDIGELADDLYNHNDYGYGDDYDGVLLLIDIENEEWCISTCGYGITAFTNAGVEYIGKKITEHFSADEYADAFLTFAELCDEFVIRARDGEPYDSHNLPKDPYDPVSGIGISLVVAFVIALISTSVMKSKLTSVHRQTRASQYVREGSMNITRANDFFLYRTITRVPRPKQTSSSGSSTHTSSSGRSHGGGRGRY